MPFPLGISPTISPKTDNPFCCIGCCSLGDVNITDPKANSSEGQQQQTASQTGGMTGQGGAAGGSSLDIFAITAQPQSGSGGNSPPSSGWLNVESSIEQQVDDVAISILNSRRAGRCCAVIYDTCSPRCTATPGCPTCGCPDGEMGCGGCGRLLCGILDSCCVVGAGGSRLRLTAFHRGLKQRFSGTVISLAEEETKINLQDLLIRGRGLTTVEKCRLEESCVKIQNALTLALGQSSKDNWKENQDDCKNLLDDPSWKSAIQQAGNKAASSPRSEVKNVLIVAQCGGSSSSCEAYSARQLGGEIAQLMVTTRTGVTGALGAFEGSFVTEVVNEIVYHHPSNLGNFWLGQLELRWLVCLVLAIRGLALQDTEGNVSDTVNHTQIRKLRRDFSGQPNCLMMSSAPLCGGLSSSRKEDPLIMSMTGDMLRTKLGEKTGKMVENQLMKRYFQARQRIEEKNKQEVVITQPRGRGASGSGTSSSSGSSFSLYRRECSAVVIEPGGGEAGAPVVKPKVKPKSDKLESRSSISSSSKVTFTKKDRGDNQGDGSNRDGNKPSFWI